MRVPDLFSGDVHTFWSTTFTFDVKLFDQFLLRRLRAQPLNAVVLCDEDCLTTALRGLTETDRRVAASANARYLLRGMRAPGGGRFHPKTHLFAGRRRTVLLVGSGNLTRPGIDRGRETFVAFDAADPDGAHVIRAWSAWIADLVAARDDARLRERYVDLRRTLAGVVGPEGDTAFVTSAAAPILDCIADRAPQTVDELHVTAPFYDEEAQALRTMIERLRPRRRVAVYLGAHTSVDGRALRRVLEAADCRAEVRRYDGQDMVHAKLIGVVDATGVSLLACGSANLSKAALLKSDREGERGANTETVVLRRGTAEEVRHAFAPANLDATAVAWEDLEQLRYGGDEEPAMTLPIRLLDAARQADRHVTVRAEPLPPGLSLAYDGAAPMALDAAGRTIEQLSPDDDPITVWLVDAAGVAQSNAVAIDDPAALDRAVSDRARTRDLPAELDDEERSELSRLLAWAHHQFIFDLDDTDAVRRSQTEGQESTAAGDGDFLERYVRDELVYDPRSPTYRPRASFGAAAPGDLLLAEIRAMLRAAPGDRRLALGAGGAPPGPPPAPEARGAPWSLSARERVRAEHLLRRWARALADPRHAWIAPDAPLRNYEALIEALTLLWLGDALRDDGRMARLLGDVWGSLLGTDQRPGFFDRADSALVEEALASLASDVMELAAGMAYVCLRAPLPWLDYLYEWQPFLVRGIEHGVFSPGPLSSDLVEAIAGERPDEHQIADLLLRRADWIDDEAWGARLASLLGVPRVSLIAHPGYKDVDVAVHVDGLTQPDRDPRVLVLAQQAMRLRGSDHALVSAGDARFLLRIGAVARARIDGQTRTSAAPIDRRRLAAVVRQNGSVADLLGVTVG